MHHKCQQATSRASLSLQVAFKFHTIELFCFLLRLSFAQSLALELPTSHFVQRTASIHRMTNAILPVALFLTLQLANLFFHFRDGFVGNGLFRAQVSNLRTRCDVVCLEGLYLFSGWQFFHLIPLWLR